MNSNYARLCSRCSSLRLTKASFTANATLQHSKTAIEGTVGYLRLHEITCGLCQLLLNALSKNIDSQDRILSNWQAEWEAIWHCSNFEHFGHTLRYNGEALRTAITLSCALYPVKKGESVSPQHVGIQLVDLDDSAFPQCHGQSRVIPETADLPLIKSWISRCEREHGPSCRPSSLATRDHPSRIPGFVVIDVKKQCVVPFPPGRQYVALSYVWGHTNYPSASKANWEIFQTEGVFNAVKLARTIRDAIEITGALGYRYIWVDAICIVQDDDKLKAGLIDNMDAIYGNAVLTILATSAQHAAAGVSSWGCRDESTTGLTFTLADFTLGLVSSFTGDLATSPYVTRGWTQVFLHSYIMYLRHAIILCKVLTRVVVCSGTKKPPYHPGS